MRKFRVTFSFDPIVAKHVDRHKAEVILECHTHKEAETLVLESLLGSDAFKNLNPHIEDCRMVDEDENVGA